MLAARSFLLLLLAASSCVLQGERAAPAPAAAPASFDAALVRRGATLAAVGNCRGCHTVAGGRELAGGRPLETPFGTIYATNITPDVQTGIGAWSEPEFMRAMQEGVDREGRHLYPAFPYDRFTLVSDADNRALYAYLMTRAPVHQRNRAHALVFPMNLRAAIGIWKRLYFKPGRYQPDATRSETWNRGAYLTEGLGHCGSCHTPRNRLGAEVRERHFQGGEAEGWHAYAIDAGNQAPVRWDEAALVRYLHEGWHEKHGVSRGPMGDVTDELAGAAREDVRAIAHYTAWWMRDAKALGSRTIAAGAASGETTAAGSTIYAALCERCHDGTQPLPFGGIAMPLSIGVAGESPRNLVNVILYGLPATAGETSPVMPGFAGALSQREVVQLATWMRARFSERAPWPDVERHVKAALEAGPKLAAHPVGGAGARPPR
jgi:mono/diheme cytochrome c family protein